jgi:hypothetical protein
MHEGDLPMYWRYNFIYYGGYDKYVEQAFSILDTLAAWGGTDTRIPVNIAVLKSRASEDWWQIRNRHNPQGNPMEQTRGFVYEKWLMELLLSGGYPFDMFYLDCPQDLEGKLEDYPLVILPFPYSISQRSFEIIEKAISEGTKVLILDRKGEADEWGNLREKPVFEDLIAEGRVEFVKDDIPSAGHYKDFLKSMRKKIDGLLGEKKPFYFNSYGQDVEFTCREKNEKEVFLCFINWEDRQVEVDAGITLLSTDVKYEVLQRDLNEVRKINIKGKGIVSAEQLGRFRIALDKFEIKILYIKPPEQ